MEKKKILIVDDEQDILEMLEKKLVNAGYVVIKAKTGVEAVNLAKRELPNLIVLDIMLSDMDGGDVKKALEDIPQTKDIPVIFLTALLRKEEEEQQKKMIQGYHFVAKPCDPDNLLEEISKYLISMPQ